MPEGLRLEVSPDFYAAPEIEEANRTDKRAVGLYVRGLSWIAALHYEHDPYCVPKNMAYSWQRGETRPDRAWRALVLTGLWEPMCRDGEKRPVAWIVVPNHLWRFVTRRQAIPTHLRKLVLQRDGRVCQLCGGEIPEGRRQLHIDHIHPVKLGGMTTLENLQAAHAACNVRKGARVE